MKRLRELTEFLMGLNYVAAEQLDSWADNPELIPLLESKGPGGLTVYDVRYDAVVVIERYPHQRHPAELLFAQIVVWLDQADPDRYDQDNLANPRIDVDILDNGTADLELTIPFVESVDAVPDPDGPIEWNGQRWQLADAEIWIAEQGGVAA
jgi:hypothetical protein